MHALCHLAQCQHTLNAVASDPEAISSFVYVLGMPLSPRSDPREYAEIRSAAASTLFCLCEAGKRAEVSAAGGVEAGATATASSLT